MRLEGRAALQLGVLDRETRDATYSDRSDVRRTEGITAGSILFGAAAVADLRQLMEQAQNEATDQLLDKPGPAPAGRAARAGLARPPACAARLRRPKAAVLGAGGARPCRPRARSSPMSISARSAPRR